MSPQNVNSEDFILLVEDDRGTCELEAQRLEPLGLPLRKAHDQEEAIAQLKAAAPRVMLLDYSLPGTNALDFIKGLRAAKLPVPPFMVVTGRGDEAVAVAAMKAGACDYIVKNSDFLENLLPAVKKTLEQISLRRELEAAQQSTAKNLHLYTFLAQVNLAAAQKKDREQLFRQICDIAVTTGGLRMAWIGLPDRDLDRLVPFCWAGAVDGYLEGIKIDTAGQTAASKGPTGRAASSLTIQPCADIAADPSMAPWREKALTRGYLSSAAIPLQEKGRLAAVLTIYSGEKGFFSGPELKLLEEIRADLSLALDSITAEESRKEAQTALERTATHLAHIMDVTPVILFTLKAGPDGQPRTDWVSGNAVGMTGYPLEEILRPSWWFNNLHPEERQSVMEAQKDLFSKRSLTQDFRFRRKDGSYFWVHSQINVSKERPGEITGSWTDITPLKESEEKFQELFEKAPVGYQSLDVNGDLLAVNDTWTSVFGYPREEALGRNFGDFLAPGYNDVFGTNFPKFKAAGKISGVEFEILRKDGEKRHITFNGRVAHNPDGSFRQTHCVFTDVTDTWKSERQAHILSEAIKASFDEIYVFDPDSFRFIFVNSGALKNLGYTEEEIEQLTPWDLKKEYTEASFRQAVRPLLESSQQQLIFESVHTRKNKTSYPVEVRLQFVKTKAASVFLAVISDVTEKKKTERLMAEMANMQRVESLGALAGGIAHDFNNMLTGIMANLSLLAAKPQDEPAKEIIHDTLEATRSAQNLTTQLLAFAKGGKPVKKEICLEKSLKDIFNLATRGTRAAAELEICEHLWSVEGDENQLKQAVNNLLVNGLQAMPSGGKLRLTADNHESHGEAAAGLKPGKYVRLLISDTGIGIPKEYLPRIYEPYFTTKAQGHGLGLPMTWSVVTNHGGRITAASEPGKGTSFELLLPATGRCLKEVLQKAAAVTKGHGRILLLEDEEIVQKAAARMLKELGYEAELTSDGKQTLDRYRQEAGAGRPFAAVIMDLTIPGGLGGKDAVKELKREFPAAKVIVSSGYSDESVMADYKTYGFDAMLPKPYRYEDLAETLAALLKE
ncbi:MAG: PAS domain S-box protein [Elusimicrobiales bacterium]|nr:PAS domain S-box protein [Elusimicrobiales bacterium]